MQATESFGYWVRRRRKALDLTQDALAQRVGCAVVTLRKIEADERRPSHQMAERLAQCLSLSPKEASEFIATATSERPFYRLKPFVEAGNDLSVSNLPVPLTSLISRSEELAMIVNRLHCKDVRLYTLTGPVGVGKTRLAIEAGLRLQHEFKDGVYLIALAPVQDHTQVPSITAAVLGMHVTDSQNLVRSIASYLAHKEMLLIFDNFEHLQPAAAFLSHLLRCAPGLRLLVTSRAVLHLDGEHEYVVSPMHVPNGNNSEDAAQSACVRLFCERAQAAQADFCLTPELVPIVAAICRRLDGLPLAIELAAVRIKLFTPKELLQRLEHRIPELVQRRADTHTDDLVLENAISWSYGLLPPTERTLLNRLAVFTSGFTLAAAEAVCVFFTIEQVSAVSHETIPEFSNITNCLAALQDQSLILRQKIDSAAGVSRFLMLETIREFALEHLQASGELETLQQRHSDYFSTWAAQAEAYLNGADRTIWLTCMEQDADNLRAALSWLQAAGQEEKAERIARALTVVRRFLLTS